MMTIQEHRLCGFTLEKMDLSFKEMKDQLNPKTYNEVHQGVIESIDYLEKYGYPETINNLQQLINGDPEAFNTVLQQGLELVDTSPEALKYKNFIATLQQHKTELINRTGSDSFQALHEHHLTQPALSKAIKSIGKLRKKKVGSTIDMATIVDTDTMVLNTESLLDESGEINFEGFEVILSDGTPIDLTGSIIVRSNNQLCFFKPPKFTRELSSPFAQVASSIDRNDTLYLAQIGDGDNSMVQISRSGSNKSYNDNIDRPNDFATEASLKAIPGGVIFNQDGELVSILDSNLTSKNGNLDDGIAVDNDQLAKNLTNNGLRTQII